MLHSLYLFAVLISFSQSKLCPLPKYLGSFKHEKAAFLNVISNPNGDSNLFITSFSGAPFSKGSVSIVTDIRKFVLSRTVSNIITSKINKDVQWPNGVMRVPTDVNIPGAVGVMQVISCGGFLVPSHGDGSCHVYDFDKNSKLLKTIEIARAGRGKFYHQAEFYDVDNDGLKDLVTAKATKGLFDEGSGSLYWYKNPGKSSFKEKWTEHLLFHGPDVHFEFVDLDKNGTPEIIVTQFFAKKLTVHYLEENASFSNSEAWTERIIDNQIGEPFNMTMVDINGDSKKEIVVTNHVLDPKLAGVYAYEIPSNFKTGEFKRHMIANDFPTLNSGPGQASPGGAIPIFNKGSKDVMFALSGDGNQKAYILCRGEGKWGWEKEELLDTGNTVGGIAVSDITGDGFSEIFVPSYEKGEIHVYTYSNI